MTNKNTIEKAQKVQEIVQQHYEPGRQDRCKLWVLKHIVTKTYPMSKSTFFRYLSVQQKQKKKVKDDRKLEFKFED